MGLFDVQFDKKVQLKKNQKDLYAFLNKKLSDGQKYEHAIERNSLSIEKNPITTSLKYNLNIEFSSPTLYVDAKLDNNYTLFITVLIILAILFTYGTAVVPIIAFVYFQKIKATKHLKALIDNYSALE